VADFFQHILNARLIDGSAEFPFERPRDFFWDPYLDAAREWFGGIFRDWLFGERAKPPLPPPPSRRELEREAPRDRLEDGQEQGRLERQRERERLLELLRQKREQRERERLE
jgi:hypothetical protein